MNIGQALALYGDVDSYERQEALWLLEHITKIPALQLKLTMSHELSDIEKNVYQTGIARLKQGEPLAYVIGSQPFWTLDLKVTSDTLVPRPDTEILVETALGLPLPQQASVLDLGTGTGAIALSLASEKLTWHVLATDIYAPTLSIAQENAQKYALSKVKFCLSTWYDQIPKQKFDLIVSNPPYIDEQDTHLENLQTEPYRALVSAEAGLADLKIIIGQSVYWLNPNGWLIVEHGYDQGEAVRLIFAQFKFSEIQTIQDYGKNDRITLGKWLNN